MKRSTLALAFAPALALSLVACGGSNAATSSAAATTSVATSTAETASVATSISVATASQTTTSSTAEQAPITATPEKEVTADDAKETALAAVGATEADVSDLKVELSDDRDDPHYDVDFVFNGMEYSVEVSSLNGTLNGIDIETVND